MLRYPCGPPSHRHQISFSPLVRSSVTPASANRDGRWPGLPSTWRLAPARAPTMTLPASAGGRGHQSRRPTSASASASSDGQRLAAGGVEQQRPALVGITLAGRAQPLVQQGRRAVRHRAQPVPDGLAQRMTARLGLDRGERTRARRRSTDSPRQARGRCPTGRCYGSAPFQQARGPAPPPLALAEPREGAARHQLPGGLGYHVVVGRGAPAGERGEVLLVPADLPHGERVALEQVGRARPVVEQAPDPGQADQADAELDAAGPVRRRTGTGSPATRSAADRRPGGRIARPG